MTMETVTVRGRRLAYADAGGPGAPVLALHGHFGRARAFAGLAAALAPEFRVIALEQRGHGLSAHADDMSPDAYVADAAAFVRATGLGPLALLGHSMGGVVAFQLAARHPELVRALIIEEAGALNRRPEVAHPVLDVRDWPRRAPTLGAARWRTAGSRTPATSWRAPSNAPTAGGSSSTTRPWCGRRKH
ncbi:alpha/beta hydrolase [Streptomyces sp. CB02959]|uniref:alpha/beta fold hydrolase n=1 Tax=Streptomyces sp. CB02959 TaxID=2020330 RepID=UPI0027E53274|nr:alpha/beta hydrolase [Streptomyces sp. CB02959]